jgi:hypothetical protein
MVCIDDDVLEAANITSMVTSTSVDVSGSGGGGAAAPTLAAPAVPQPNPAVQVQDRLRTALTQVCSAPQETKAGMRFQANSLVSPLWCDRLFKWIFQEWWTDGKRRAKLFGIECQTK